MSVLLIGHIDKTRVRVLHAIPVTFRLRWQNGVNITTKSVQAVSKYTNYFSKCQGKNCSGERFFLILLNFSIFSLDKPIINKDGGEEDLRQRKSTFFVKKVGKKTFILFLIPRVLEG